MSKRGWRPNTGFGCASLGMTSRATSYWTSSFKVGGKGLFVKELETALLDGRADIAVHSMKDVPMVMPDGLTLGVICEREDPRDALVGCTASINWRRARAWEHRAYAAVANWAVIALICRLVFCAAM